MVMQLRAWCASTMMALPVLAGAQDTAAGPASVWAADLVPVVRPSLAGSTLLAIAAEPTSAGDSLSPALAAALAAAVGVPGAASLDLANLPICVGSPESSTPGERRGVIASVRWHPGEAPNRGAVTVAVICMMQGRPFSQGTTRPLVRGADGRWAPDGPWAEWIS